MSSPAPHPATVTQLAINGGTPVFPEGPPVWPIDDPDVRAAVERALNDGSWGRSEGQNGPALIAALAEFFQTEFVTLCSSGTFAVQLALRGLGVGPSDEVLLAGYDFPGNFRAIEAVGATPVLVDVDACNWNLAPVQLAGALSDKTRAVIVSHLHGGVVPMRGLTGWAREHGIAVVEDACQAPGATVQGRLAGTWGDVGVLSFGGSKLLTAGRGGAILTRDASVHQRAKIFCDQGNQAYPLSELQAVVLLPQLRKLPERHARRAESVTRLLGQLAGLPGLRPLQNNVADSQPAYYKLGFQYVSEELHGRPRDEFIAAVQAEGVAIDAGFRGFVLRGERRCRRSGSLNESARAAAGTLVLHHPVLLEPPRVTDRLAEAMIKVTRALGAAP